MALEGKEPPVVPPPVRRTLRKGLVAAPIAAVAILSAYWSLADGRRPCG